MIRQYTESAKNIEKALKQMVQNGLLSTAGFSESDTTYSLTEAGEKEANKVLRAHRLWETYLSSIGTPEEEVHATAHQLEHLKGNDAVDYLDEKLGSPTEDPHGKEIPQSG